jgi:two-component system response regulator
MKELSILVVEDNEDDRFLTIRMIKKLPFAVTIEVAKNGDDALKRLLPPESPGVDLPSLILLDLQLPKIGGITLLTKIRACYDATKLPVIILSSSDNPGDIAVCNDLGISGYLSKPPELESLQLYISTIIST